MTKETEIKDNVILAGEFGFGNYGAEADLVVLSQRLSEELDSRHIALSFSPEETSRLYGMDAYGLLSPRGIWRWMTRRHAVVAGGQNFDTTLYGRRNWLGLYLSLLLLFRKMLGKKSQLRAVGVYSLTGLPRTLLRMALQGSEIITARDQRSEEVLEEIGCVVSGREPCPARELAPASSREAQDILRREGFNPSKPSIIFSLRRTNLQKKDESFAKVMAEAADWCVSRLGHDVLLLPSCQHKYKRSEDDSRFMANILDRVHQKERVRLLPGKHPPDILAGLCAGAVAVVTTRHHIMALCDAVGTTSIPLDIGKKIEAYLHESGKDGTSLPIDNTLLESLKKRLREVID